MQQSYSTRNYSIKDFDEWNNNGELELSPEFQRRSVWNPKARSYLIDTILRGKPIPKIFMRHDTNPETRRTKREVVDGQQRLRAILDYLNDEFEVLPVHNQEFGDKRFSQLDDESKREFLSYELAVDLLLDLPDKEIYDMFARLNTYSVVLNAQEQRNGQYFGEFKTIVYEMANDFLPFWKGFGIFSETDFARMNEAEFVSELLIASVAGIKARSKTYIDNFYKFNDDQFPNRDIFPNKKISPDSPTLVRRFKAIMDLVGETIKDTFIDSKMRESRMIYPLFCSLYHMQYGLPDFEYPREKIQSSKIKRLSALSNTVDDIFERLRIGMEEADRVRGFKEGLIELSEDEIEDLSMDEKGELQDIDPTHLLTIREKEFVDAYNVRWVHAEKRRTATIFISDLISKLI